MLNGCINVNSRIPFGSKTLITEYIVLYLQIIATTACVAVLTVAFTFHMSCSLMVNAFCNDIQTMFDRMDAIASYANSTSNLNRLRMKNQFGKIIDFHCEILTYVSSTSSMNLAVF